MKKFMHVIVLGGGLEVHSPKNFPKNKNIRGNVESRMRAVAAGEFYRLGLAEKIIFSGGKTKGKTFESEAESMRKYFCVRFPEVPEENILLEEESFNTQNQAEILGKTIEVGERVAVITSTSHLLRSLRLFKNNGVSADVFSAEKLLSLRGSRSMGFVEKYFFSTRFALSIFREVIQNILLFVDPAGYLLGAISKRTRHQNS